MADVFKRIPTDAKKKEKTLKQMQTKGADKAQENFRHNLAQADRQTGFKYPPILKSNEGQVCSENGGKVKQRQEVEGGV